MSQLVIPLFDSPDHKGPKGTNASVNKRIKRGGMLMRKAFTFIKKVIGKFKFSITIKLPLINVTLAPSIIQQSLIRLLFLFQVY